MIDSYTATLVIVGFLVIFGIVIPILDKVPKIKNFVSFRWTLVIVYSALCIGVIIDFEHLDNTVRFAVVLGGIVLSALFLIVRSIEKAFINNWHLPHTRASVAKGDTTAELSINPKTRVPQLEAESQKNSSNKNKQEQLSEYIKSKENKKEFDELMNNCLLFTDENDTEKEIKENNSK